MGSGPAWSCHEDHELCRLVRAYGCHWATIARSGSLPLRSAHSMRARWSVLRPSPPVVELCPVKQQPVLSGLSVPGGVRSLPPNQGRALSRCSSAGRPWDFIVRHSRGLDGVGSAILTDRRKSLIDLWHLAESRPGADLLLCDLHRAESIVREHLRRRGVSSTDLNDAVLSTRLCVRDRDSLGLVWYPGEVCCTLTSSSAHERWVGGPAAGRGRFVTPSESAAFQGLDTHSGSFCSAQYHLTEIQLHHAIGASLHSRMADYLATAARSLLRRDVDAFSLGSLYSGAFDELGAAVKRVFGPVSTHFTAEKDASFNSVLPTRVS